MYDKGKCIGTMVHWSNFGTSLPIYLQDYYMVQWDGQKPLGQDIKASVTLLEEVIKGDMMASGPLSWTWAARGSSVPPLSLECTFS